MDDIFLMANTTMKSNSKIRSQFTLFTRKKAVLQKRSGLFVVLFLLFFCLNTLGQHASLARIQLRFQSVVGSDTLQLGKQYTGSGGDTFTITDFKYYLHHFYLVEKKSGKKWL